MRVGSIFETRGTGYAALLAVIVGGVISEPSPALSQGVENPTAEQLLATATLIAVPSSFVDTFTVADPHTDGTAAKMYKFTGVAGDSVTIYAGSMGLDLGLVLAEVTEEFMMVDQDSGTGLNATIDAELPLDGTYFIMVLPSREREYGEFSLAVTEGARARAGQDEDEVTSPLEAGQNRWLRYGRSDSGWFFYDRETVNQEADGVSVRARIAYREIRETVSGEAYDSRLMHLELRCGGRESRVSDLIDTRGGAVVDRTDVTGEWTTILAGSVTEGLLEELCPA